MEEGLYVPDLCELTYTNTLLLSNAALSLGLIPGNIFTVASLSVGAVIL